MIRGLLILKHSCYHCLTCIFVKPCPKILIHQLYKSQGLRTLRNSCYHCLTCKFVKTYPKILIHQFYDIQGLRTLKHSCYHCLTCKFVKTCPKILIHPFCANLMVYLSVCWECNKHLQSYPHILQTIITLAHHLFLDVIWLPILDYAVGDWENKFHRDAVIQVGGSNSYASHSSKGTKSLTNTAFSVQEDVQSKNDTFQDDVLGNKSTHWRKQIANLSEAQKSVIKFVDDEKSHCKTHGSINGAITTQQEQLLDSEPKASIAIINLEEFETRQFGESLEKEVSLQHTDFPVIETRCLKGPCTGRMENGIHTANILAAESHENLKLNWESKEDFEAEINNELLLGEAFFPSQENLYERISKTKELQPNEFFLASVLSDCGAFETDGEGIADSIFDCELELDEIEESECPFDDFWTEILDVIHLEQESRDSYSADTVKVTESEVPLHIQDEDELDLLNYQEEPKDPKIANVDTSIDLDIVEDEINLPDEDSLISVDHLLSLSDHCSEVTFVGRTDRLKPNLTSDSTGHPEVAHCYEKSFLPGRKVSSSAIHQKPYPHQISSKTSCIHVNPEIPTFHPLDLYFTCSHFKNIREEKHGHYYPPAIYFYPWSKIHHESSMKTAPAMEKKYEHLERYPMLYQPDNSLQHMELLRESQADPSEHVVYDVVQQWDDMQKLPETYHQQLHYPGFGFPI
ncbi:uncharacterized protein [Solanum lycopersicum]|uniref:uncharacterized protein isoform X4 n=1 Tax=Solanum lycopersicum TaxID=4081 RepID=UPI00374A878C